MQRRWLLVPVLLICTATSLAASPQDIPNPRHDGGWVVDQAEVLDEATEARLEATLGELERETTVEIAVVTVEDTELTPKEFTTALFDMWGIGKAGSDNGLLTVMVIGQRRLEMETGYGLEPILSDSWLGTMQAEQMVPHFKEGDYGAGLEAGIDASVARLREHALEARLGRKARDLPSEPWPEQPLPVYGSGIPRDEILAGSAGLAGLGLFGGLFLILRRRRRTCPHCKVYMPMLSETEDDEHLSAGQRKEEELESVNWKVHACPTCEHTRSFRSAAWFSGYSRCPRCRYKTRSSTRTTLQRASYSSEGKAQVTERCAQCSYHSSRTVTIPRKQRPRPSSSSSSSSRGSSWSSSSSSSSWSSSSSSSSSFGGGRSGGGGAGSSW
jgi:uncharacterized protein